MRLWQRLAIQAAIVGSLLGLWEAASRLAWVNPRLLPPFSKVAERIGVLIRDSEFLGHLAFTASEVALATLIVAPFGILIGVLLAESDYLGAAFRPFFNFLASVPKSVFLPIFILLFGIGFSQKVAFGIFQAIFVLVITTIGAVAGVSHELIRVARASGATSLQIYREIYWPAMLPVILEGLRLGVIFSVTGVVFAEMYVARAGAGFVIAQLGQAFELPDLLAAIIITALFSIAINETLRVYEHRVGRWRG